MASSSSISITQAEQIIANHAFFFIEDCANYAQAAVIFYEYLITLDDEVRLIWRRKLTGASVIFFFNRYNMVLQNAITVASFWPISNTACAALGWMDLFLDLFPYFIWNAFSTLRVYALCGRDWRIASLVCLLMCGPIVANVYNIPMQRPDNMPQPYNCSMDNSITVAVHTKLVLLSRCTLIAADSIVLGVTWWKTWRIKQAADAARIKTSLVDLLLRDGTIYFATMLVLNVLHILINFIEQVSFMGDIAIVLTSILISRFIMHLRDADALDTGAGTRTDGARALETWNADRSTGGGADAEGRRGAGTLVFASNFTDSLGGPLEYERDAQSVGGGEERDQAQADMAPDDASLGSGEVKV